MFTNSIRGRFVLWVTFLLLAVLTAFGVAAYQFQRLKQAGQLDKELERRMTALLKEIDPPGLREPGRRPNDIRPGPPDLNRDFPSRPLDGRPDRRKASGTNTNTATSDSRPGPGGMTESRQDRSPGFEPGFPDGPPPSSDDFDMRLEDRENRHPPFKRGRTRDITLPPETMQLFNEADTNAFYFSIWSPDGELRRITTNAPASLRALKIPKSPRENVNNIGDRLSYREATRSAVPGFLIVVGCTTAEDRRALHQYGWMLVAVAGAVLALGLVGAWLTASHAIRPITEISATAERIAAGDLSLRIPLPAPGNELGRLAQILNSSFARLNAAFSRQQQFTADAAHELRTPVSVILMHAENGLAVECEHTDHREAFEACQRSAQRMRRLTESLLELSRLDADSEAKHWGPVDLSQIAKECVDSVQPLSIDRNIKINCDLSRVECRGDKDQLAQVVTNLVTNAIEYNQPAGEVNISTRIQDDTAVLTVSDTGIGIPAEHVPRVFDRFYRADPSRTGKKGHAGLGLAVVKAIVDVHGGKIKLTSQPGVGTTFAVCLPIAKA
jgi:heavy metal sensor kinase